MTLELIAMSILDHQFGATDRHDTHGEVNIDDLVGNHYIRKLVESELFDRIYGK